jgi:Cd2+/Zn2+-exporting ATPase
MDQQPPISSDNPGDTSTHVVITHLHARIAELEQQVASLRKKQEQPPLAARGKALVATAQTTVADRLRKLKPDRLPWQQPSPAEHEGIPTTEEESESTPARQQQHQQHQTQTTAPAEHTADTSNQESGSSELKEEEAELAELPLMVRMTVITLVSLLLGWASEQWLPIPAVAWVLYAIAYINGSFYSVQEAWESLKERQFDVNLLMIAAALGAAAIGQPLEGAVLMFLFSLSQTLETYAMGRTHASMRALIAMTPQTARLVRSINGTEHEEEVPIEQVAVGEVVRVRPGEQIPADGEVVRGSSAVNEASITGESMPVEKQPGVRVFAGTLNGQGAMDVRVTTAIEDSTLAHVVKIVRQAREQKASSQHFTDRVIGQYYAYTVVGITLAAIIVPLVFLGWEVQPTIYRAITLMVGASPCALVISIPAAILSALASSSWNGVLFKGGKHLESASRIKVVAFDKTGTLTTGRHGVAAIVSLDMQGENVLDDVHLPTNENGTLAPGEARLLAIAAAVERFSEHPLAQAIVAEAHTHQLALPETGDFEALAGAGVRATWNGYEIQIGRPSLFTQVQNQQLPADFTALIEQQEQQGRTVIMVGQVDQVWGALALSDTVRSESADIVANLRAAGIERVVLLTGDNHLVANHIGQMVGVDEVWSALTPTEKVDAIRTIQAKYGAVAMVGDGINDAPALATAHLGVAMGAAGTDVAMESADVVLMSDDLSRLPGTLQLARRTRQVVQQNLVVAFGVMLVLIGLALVGILPLPLATVAHEGSTLLVVANGLRLLAPWR